MGRPNQCNVCCGDTEDPVDPPIGDCQNVICIAFIDENEKSYQTIKFPEKMAKWRQAYPNRLIFILDVKNANPDLYYVTYPENFITWDKAFSLRLEYEKDPTGLINFINRDNGNNTIANNNDPWERIKTIVNRYGGNISTLFNNSPEVSIFVDDSGSMKADQVRATVDKLRSDITADGKVIVSSIINKNEDIMCPFVQDQCCTGDASEELMNLCGLNVNCTPNRLRFTIQPQEALIREYCSILYPNGSPYKNVCNVCVTNTEEDNRQTIEYKALATDSKGKNLDYVQINYFLQYTDDLTTSPTWYNVQESRISTGFSGNLKSTSVLTNNTCHPWLLAGSNACTLPIYYLDYLIGESCIKRTWKRKFRIRAVAVGYTPTIATSSNSFTLYEWRNTN